MKEQKIKQDGSIGQNIKKLRRRAGLTQEQVATQMQLYGCSVTRISYIKIENGMQHIWVSELKTLKEILHAEYWEFFEDETENHNNS